MAIRINTRVTDGNLKGLSHWWGAPDLPEGMAYPCINVKDEDGGTYPEPLTFVCQIRCADIAELDPEGLLPHRGMLYFFAPIDYFEFDWDEATYRYEEYLPIALTEKTNQYQQAKFVLTDAEVLKAYATVYRVGGYNIAFY